MAQTTLAYVGLGSNLGDRENTIRRAVQHLDGRNKVRVTRVSALRETAALGQAQQPAYLNGVAEVETNLPVRDFFGHLMDIEGDLGRVRSGPWSARTIDLDLLLFGSEVVADPDLQVPHGGMLLRHFVLQPLAELQPQLCIPGLNEAVSILAERLRGHSYVYPRTRAFVVAVAGNIGAGKTTLADRLGARLGAEVLHEPYATNPFLPQVYAGRQELALDSQLYFLANRVDQLSTRSLEPGTIYLTDYLFEKEQVYADLLLEGEPLELYQRLYPHLAGQVVPPSLVLYLRHEVQGCLTRIQHRGRAYEKGIQEGFLHALQQAYEALLGRWDRCPVIDLSVPEFDSLRESDLHHLMGQIRAYRRAAVDEGNLLTEERTLHAGR
jgi:2-amino-4-hydroxy-6-hydroxymethyldihydropteridine diphosphokinase